MTGYFDTFEVIEAVRCGDLLTDEPPGNWFARKLALWRHPDRLYKARRGQTVKYVAARSAEAHSRIRVQHRDWR